MKGKSIKLRNALLLCLPLMALASCKKDETATVYTYELTSNATGTINMPVETNDILCGKWQAGESIAALDVSSSIKKKVILTNSAAATTVFTGSSTTNFEKNHNVTYFYPASALQMASSDTLTQVLTTSGQDGTLESAAKFAYACAKKVITINETERSAAIDLNPLMAIANFSFTYNGSPLQKIASIAISASEGDFYTERTMNLRALDWANNKGAAMTVTNSAGLNGSATVSVFPCTNAKLEFIIKTTDGAAYEATSPQVTFSAGEYQAVPSVTCTTITERAHVGDYFYDDNTWSTTLNESKKCVGIVYVLCNADGSVDRNLTESTSGRVVALKNVSSTYSAWANVAETITGLDSLKTADGTNEIFLLTTTAAIPTVGAAATFYKIPYTTTRYISSYYAANRACYYYINGKKGYGNWELPSAGDLALIYTQREYLKTRAARLIDLKQYEEFGEVAYWSSTIYGFKKAWAVNFYNGALFANSKTSAYYLRAVTTF